MTAPTTRDGLGIFVSGEERPGLTMYGYWPSEEKAAPHFPSRLWPPGVEVRESWLGGADWSVCVWDVAVHDWPAPADWQDVLAGSLGELLRAGAIVGWCGLEGFFADPPHLFDPEEMSGGVYAASAPGWGFRCTAELDGPLRALPDSDLLALRSLISGD